MKNKRIAVTGIGPICSLGSGKKEVWNSLLEEKVNINKQEHFIDGKLWDAYLTHEVGGFDIKNYGIDKPVLAELESWKEGRQDKDLFYALASIKLALDDSALKFDKDDNDIGLFLTVEHPGFEPFIAGMIEETLSFLSSGKGVSKQEAFNLLYSKFVDRGYDLQVFMYLYLLAKAFNIHGYSLFTSNACASGLFAIDAAVKQIKTGALSTAIVTAGDDTCTIFKHKWFNERRLYAEDGNIKPFSRNADGVVFGDGYSTIILEDYDQAVKRKAHIYAEYLGGSFVLEGWKVVFPNTAGDAYQKMIRKCLKASNVKAKSVDLVNPHGVGIKITDMYEAKAISDVFGKNTPVSAFKPLVGHNLGGSAILETIILLLALENNIIPPTLNCEDFDQSYGINLIRSRQTQGLKTVMKLSCGFAGYSGAAIFRKHGKKI